MGDPKRRRRKYETPLIPWSAETLENELRLLGEYGLRNKRELWRHRTEVSRYRKLARGLLAMPAEQGAAAGAELLAKLQRLGVVPEGASVDSILDLTLEDLLERRLQTVVYRQGLAKTAQQARQLITHGHITVGDRVVRAPSYYVSGAAEKTVSYAPYSRLAQTEHPARVSIESAQSTRKMREAEEELRPEAGGREAK